MQVTVLGAGVVGVTSAWYLSRAGHAVTVVDRQPAPARETSYANGGQISVSHAEPWANPGAPLQILRWLGREDAPLLWRPRASLAQWAWALAFLRECLPGRSRRNSEAILALAMHSHAALAALRAQTGIEYHAASRGILQVFEDAASLARARAHLPALRAAGWPAEELSPARCAELEPALAASRVPIAGGILAPRDETGDARVFTERLAALCEAQGVRFRLGTHIEALCVSANRVTAASVRDASGAGRIEADAWVVALGSWGPALLAPLGVRIPVYPVKGYSVTLPAGPGAPRISITDESRKIVITRLGERLRAAGTAELAGHDLAINEARCRAILHRVLEFFPDAGDAAQAEFWAGLRPATPGNLPVIGRTRYPNLFLNTGHGTLGWTLACGSGQALAEIVSGRAAGVQFPFREA